jgi:hypothetical protein
MFHITKDYYSQEQNFNFSKILSYSHKVAMQKLNTYSDKGKI